MAKNDGGSAFPGTYPENQYDYSEMCGKESWVGAKGMSLRDWFAGHAPPMPDQWFQDSPRKKSDPLWHWGEASAAWAYFYAGAMIAERDKE